MKLKFYVLILWGGLCALSHAHDFKCDVRFRDQGKSQELIVEMTTQRLSVKTMAVDDYSFYKSLMKNEACHSLYSSGSLPSDEFLNQRLAILRKKSEQGDPYTTYTLRLKASSCHQKDFPIGWIDLSKDLQGLEISLMIHPDHWRQGYGTEVVAVICKGFIPWIKENHKKWFHPDQKVDDIAKAYAWIRPMNRASQKIFANLGFNPRRIPYSLPSDEIIYEWEIQR